MPARKDEGLVDDNHARILKRLADPGLAHDGFQRLLPCGLVGREAKVGVVGHAVNLPRCCLGTRHDKDNLWPVASASFCDALLQHARLTKACCAQDGDVSSLQKCRPSRTLAIVE